MLIRSLTDCFERDTLNIDSYVSYKKYQAEEEQRYNFSLSPNGLKRTINTQHQQQRKRIRTSRSTKKHPLMLLLDDGSEMEVLPEDTMWYLLYVLHSPRNPKEESRFRNRFRLPHHDFF